MKKRFLILVVILCLSMTVFASAYSMEGVNVEEYNPEVDYMELMYECAKTNNEYSLMIGHIYELQRNMKIEDMGLNVEKTNFFVDNVTDNNILENIEKYLGINQEPEQPELIRYYSDFDALMMAKVAYCEARGIKSKTEIACVMWTILNRVDKGGYGGSIAGVITAPNQFAYRASAPTVSDRGYDLLTLAYDVLDNWSKEKSGRTDYVRCLPSDYLWYAGDGQHNYFRNAYGGGSRWNYAWGYPYG